jgi:uncharacterized membrane protein
MALGENNAMKHAGASLEISSSPPINNVRFESIDALRGFAMLWMTAFHFCFDLQHFGFLQANFYSDPFWTLQRTAIVSLFIFCAGFSQAIALYQGQSVARFFRRWRQIAGCALLVTIGSYLMYPRSFIYFGILHGIALMLLVVRAWETWPGLKKTTVLLVLGALAISLPMFAGRAYSAWNALEVFNSPALNWLGFISRKPVTEDYAPLLPWLGVMLWGVAAGQWCVLARPDWLQAQISKPLATLGRWSLSYYMLHQPVMIGFLSLVVSLR